MWKFCAKVVEFLPNKSGGFTHETWRFCPKDMKFYPRILKVAALRRLLFTLRFTRKKWKVYPTDVKVSPKRFYPKDKEVLRKEFFRNYFIFPRNFTEFCVRNCPEFREQNSAEFGKKYHGIPGKITATMKIN
jgi:hypothetical protein